MLVILKYKTKDGQRYKTNKTMLVKEAKDYFNKHLKNDKSIVRVILTHFDGWHTRLHAVLKDTETK